MNTSGATVTTGHGGTSDGITSDGITSGRRDLPEATGQRKRDEGTSGTPSGPLVIQVHSGEFTIDLGHLSKQDPYIKIKIGLHKEKTTAKTRAGKSATWEETLTFTKLEKLDGTDHIVHISARDKNILRDNIIGKVSIPLTELLRQQGKRDIELYDNEDPSKLTGHVFLTVTSGHDSYGQGLISGHDKGLTAAHGAGQATLGTGAVLASHDGRHGERNLTSGDGSGPDGLVIQVISAQFSGKDHDLISKQDPYIKITIGHQTEKTSSKSGAGRSATWGESLTFSNLEKLTGGRSHDVLISAKDKDLIKDDEIGHLKIPLSELLRYQGQQHEYELFDPKHSSQIVGRVTLIASSGGGVGLGTTGPGSVTDTGAGHGAGLGGAALGTGAALAADHALGHSGAGSAYGTSGSGSAYGTSGSGTSGYGAPGYGQGDNKYCGTSRQGDTTRTGRDIGTATVIVFAPAAGLATEIHNPGTGGVHDVASDGHRSIMGGYVPGLGVGVGPTSLDSGIGARSGSGTSGTGTGTGYPLDTKTGVHPTGVATGRGLGGAAVPGLIAGHQDGSHDQDHGAHGVLRGHHVTAEGLGSGLGTTAGFTAGGVGAGHQDPRHGLTGRPSDIQGAGLGADPSYGTGGTGIGAYGSGTGTRESGTQGTLGM